MNLQALSPLLKFGYGWVCFAETWRGAIARKATSRARNDIVEGIAGDVQTGDQKQASLSSLNFGLVSYGIRR
jgi:hypothetical protein